MRWYSRRKKEVALTFRGLCIKTDEERNYYLCKGKRRLEMDSKTTCVQVKIKPKISTIGTNKTLFCNLHFSTPIFFTTCIAHARENLIHFSHIFSSPFIAFLFLPPSAGSFVSCSFLFANVYPSNGRVKTFSLCTSAFAIKLFRQTGWDEIKLISGNLNRGLLKKFFE